VILVDTNLLIYAETVCPQQVEAAAWLDAQLTGQVRVGIPWASLLGFLRVTTNRRIYPHPLGVDAAWLHVEKWLSWPNVWIPVPTGAHASILAVMLAAAKDGANLINDAHLAALAVEHGLTLCSTDGDFARFPALKWFNPLQPGR